MTATAAQAENTSAAKPYIPLERGWWRTPLLFMLSLSMVGLEIWPAIALSILFLAHSWRNDRYEFMIMLMFVCGGFGLYNVDQLPVCITDIAMLVSIVLWFIYRKPLILKKTLVALCIMIIFMFAISFMSVESFTVQVFMMRKYWYILCIILPFAVFSGKEFDFAVFAQKLLPYMVLMAIFYILDGFVICGHVLVPKETNINDSTFYDPAFHPLSGNFYRIYPPGLYFYILLFIPILRNYRLHWWQWALFAGAFIACQTFTVIIAFLAVFIVFQGSLRSITKWSLLGIILLAGIYVVDGMLPTVTRGESTQTQLRIKSSIDQFVDLYNAVDDEDIANFASGRMAQVLPKVEIVNREHRQLIGLGFLHPQKTTLNQYIIENEYYSDIEQAEEVSTGVEISQVQVFIQMGWLGLIVLTVFYLSLYLIIRKLKYSYIFLSTMIFTFISGFGGFITPYTAEGCMLLAYSFAIPILAERDKLGFNCPWLKRRGRRAELCQSLPHTDGAYGHSAQALR